MTTPAVDTLAIAKELEKTGMPREQAETLAHIQQRTVAQAIEAKDLATKKDLLELKSDITRMFINGMLALAGFMVASLAVVVALLK